MPSARAQFCQTLPKREKEFPAHANDEPGDATRPKKHDPNRISHVQLGLLNEEKVRVCITGVVHAEEDLRVSAMS